MKMPSLGIELVSREYADSSHWKRARLAGGRAYTKEAPFNGRYARYFALLSSEGNCTFVVETDHEKPEAYVFMGGIGERLFARAPSRYVSGESERVMEEPEIDAFVEQFEEAITDMEWYALPLMSSTYFDGLTGKVCFDDVAVKLPWRKRTKKKMQEGLGQVRRTQEVYNSLGEAGLLLDHQEECS